MIATTLSIPAGPTAVARNAAGASARPGVDEVDGLGTFTRALETASTEVTPPKANRADPLRDRPSRPPQDVVAKPEQRVAPAATLPGRSLVVVTTPAAVPAVEGDSLRRAKAVTALMRDEPPVATQDVPAAAELSPADRPSTVGAMVPEGTICTAPAERPSAVGVMAPEGTICTAPAAANDATALLAELQVRHAAGPATAEVDRPAVQPGPPSPIALSLTSPVADGRQAKIPRSPDGTERVGPAPGHVDAPVTVPLTDAEQMPGGTKAATPAAEEDEAESVRAFDAQAGLTLNETDASAVAPDGIATPASIPSLDSSKVAPPGSGAPSALAFGSQAEKGGRDTPVDLPPPSMTPTSASPGEQAAVRTDVTGASFTLPAVLPSGGAVGTTAAPMVEGRLGAAPGSADFGLQFGAQITTFVREGVQHARLHLNPAELGPVTVRIQLDGQAAQVHLAADNALTRQALEQSMPLLAGSLREAGLTLSGGGVFEQPRQRNDETPAASGSGLHQSDKDDRGAEATLRPLAAALVRRGVVDLVA